MEHITMQHGSETNLLKLTKEELDALEPFLRTIGVRMRTCVSYGGEYEVQADNPYRQYAYAASFHERIPGEYVRKYADKCMTDDGIAVYKH